MKRIIKKSNLRQPAFTLAEVLITLGIIGVVAAITMPPLIANIQSQVKAKRIQNIEQKFSKATDKMLAIDGMNGYGSTMNFVNTLKDHLKIAKICDNDNLRGCWPYDEVTLSKEKGTKYDISNTKTASELKMTSSDTKGTDWDDTVGIITADGTPMILSYNKKCDMSVNINPQWDENKSTSSNCVAMIFDWNGGKGPNLYSNLVNGDKADVISFNSNGLHDTCALITAGDKCFGAPFKPTALTKADCEKYKNELGIQDCYYDADYWAGAVKQCGGVDNMPSADDLAKIASLMYEGNPTIGAKQEDSPPNLTYISGMGTSLGFGEPYFHVWSGEEWFGDDVAYFQDISDTYTEWNNSVRYDSGIQAVCLVD